MTGDAGQKYQKEHDAARNPGDLSGFFITDPEENMDQVYDKYANNYIGADYMDQAKKPAIWDFVGYGLNALEGMIRMGYIVEKEHDAGNDLGHKGY